MCFFFSCSPWHKPTPYFKGTCNKFGFGLIFKSKDQLLISDDSDGSSTSVFSSIIFQKWQKKNAIFRRFQPPFSRKSGKMLSETSGATLFAQKKSNLQGCVIIDKKFRYCVSFLELWGPYSSYNGVTIYNTLVIVTYYNFLYHRIIITD